MRPVNLLPERFRAAGPSGRRSGSSYVLLGALGAVLLGMLVYAYTANQASSREAEAAEARSAADQAEAEAAALAPFGAFQQVEQTREAAVRSLAAGRVDWERLARELAHVLPEDVRLESFEGSTGEGAAADASGEASSSSPPASSTEDLAGPSVVLAGCARSQPSVATTLVRLRRLNGAQDVTLQDSTDSSTTAPQPSGGPAGGSAGDCSAYSFNATVVLAPAAAPLGAQVKADSVPASLGGGQ